jgi:putative transposase
VHTASLRNYGSPRVWFELAVQGGRCSQNTVAKLMREHGIRPQTKRRFVNRTTDSQHDHPVAENRLNRQFEQSMPNQAWAADITYIPTAVGCS